MKEAKDAATSAHEFDTVTRKDTGQSGNVLENSACALGGRLLWGVILPGGEHLLQGVLPFPVGEPLLFSSEDEDSLKEYFYSEKNTKFSSLGNDSPGEYFCLEEICSSK